MELWSSVLPLLRNPFAVQAVSIYESRFIPYFRGCCARVAEGGTKKGKCREGSLTNVRSRVVHERGLVRNIGILTHLNMMKSRMTSPLTPSG
eukprot:5941472-Pyramimonas_sp.AAC.1